MCACLADDPGYVGTDYVSDISAVKGARGGVHVEDEFKIQSTDMVEHLIGEFNAVGKGALVLRPVTNTLVMLVPPLEFKFKTKRSEGDKWPTELVVTGHFVCLVDRKGKKGPRWAFDDERAEYTPQIKLAYKQALAAARALGDVVPARLMDFLEPL